LRCAETGSSVDIVVLVLIALLVPLLCWRLGKVRKFLLWIPICGAFVYGVTAYIAMGSTDDAEWASAIALIALLVGYVVCMLFVLIAVQAPVRNQSKS
jgi:hypothetical protein